MPNGPEALQGTGDGQYTPVEEVLLPIARQCLLDLLTQHALPALAAEPVDSSANLPDYGGMANDSDLENAEAVWQISGPPYPPYRPRK